MSEMLCRELTFAEQSALASMAQHPGFQVFVKLLDEYCRISAAAPMKINPTDPRYDDLLKTAVMTARITNDVVLSLRKSVITHVDSAEAKKHQDEVDAQIEEETEKIMGTIRILSRRDNEQ